MNGHAFSNPSAGTFPALLLKPPEAARLLAISERTLWTLTQAGDIPAVRIGRSVRYDIETLKQYIADQQQSQSQA